MYVAIVGGSITPENYKKLDDAINKVIEEKQIYLFYILCGTCAGPAQTIGRLWAERNGAPIQWIVASTPAALQNQLLKKADYIFFLLDGNQVTKNLIMKYKMMGKHGTVIQL